MTSWDAIPDPDLGGGAHHRRRHHSGRRSCDPMPTRRSLTVDKQSGPYSSQLRSTSPTSAGPQLGSAVRQHDYDGGPFENQICLLAAVSAC